jgi:hypothetical protein
MLTLAQVSPILLLNCFKLNTPIAPTGISSESSCLHATCRTSLVAHCTQAQLPLLHEADHHLTAKARGCCRPTVAPPLRPAKGQ